MNFENEKRFDAHDTFQHRSIKAWNSSKNVFNFWNFNFNSPLSRYQVRIRKSLLPNLLSSLKEAVASIKWLFLLYFCFGEKIKESILCPSLATGHACSKSSSQVRRSVCFYRYQKYFIAYSARFHHAYLLYSALSRVLQPSNLLPMESILIQIPMNSLLGLTEMGVLWKAFVAVSFLTFSHKLIKVIKVSFLTKLTKLRNLSFVLMLTLRFAVFVTNFDPRRLSWRPTPTNRWHFPW